MISLMKIGNDLHELIFRISKLIMHILMAIRTVISRLTILNPIGKRHHHRILNITSLTFLPLHFTFPSSQRIASPAIRLYSVLVEQFKVFEDNHVIAAA